MKLADAKLLFDIAVRLQLYVEGVKAHEVRRVEKYLQEIEDDFARILLTVQYDKLDALSKRELTLLVTKLRQANVRVFSRYVSDTLERLELFMQAALKVNRVSYAYATKQLDVEEDDDNEELPTDEESSDLLGAGLFGLAAIVAGAVSLWPKIVNAPVPAIGALPKDYLLGWAATSQVNIENVLRRGYANAWTPRETLIEAQSVIHKVNNASNSVLRTEMQHIATMVSAAVTSGLFGKYQWLSVIDSATTDICRSLNLQIFEFGKGPIPPAHTGCRSSIMPIGKGEGAPPEKFGAWIKRQPADIRDFALKDGEYHPSQIDIEDFADSASKIVGKK